MRRVRNGVILAALGLFLGASLASATELSARAHREPDWSASILDQLGALLTVVWERVGCVIDPWGGCTTGGKNPPEEEPVAPSPDGGLHIDPLGGCGS